MRKVLLPFFSMLSFFAYAQISVPDQKFLDALKAAGTDADHNGSVSVAEAENVTVLDLHSKEISDLTGIEYFINVEELNVGHNQLSELDITKLTKLKSLSGAENNLSSLDLSANPLLEHIDIQSNKLTCIDLSNHVNLKAVYLNNNPLTGVVNVSGSHSLSFFQSGSCPDITSVCVFSVATAIAGGSRGNFVKSEGTEWSETCASSDGKCDVISAVRNMENFSDVKILVNETENQINLEIAGKAGYGVQVYNLSGQAVSKEVFTAPGVYKVGNNLENGMYIIRISRGEEVKSYKIHLN
jgi:hypothetical protein